MSTGEHVRTFYESWQRCLQVALKVAIDAFFRGSAVIECLSGSWQAGEPEFVQYRWPDGRVERKKKHDA